MRTSGGMVVGNPVRSRQPGVGGPSGLGFGNEGGPFSVGRLLHQHVGLVRQELLLPPLDLGPADHLSRCHSSGVCLFFVSASIYTRIALKGK